MPSTKGHLSKVWKHNQPTKYTEKKKNSNLGKTTQQENILQMKEQDKTPEEELSGGIYPIKSSRQLL